MVKQGASSASAAVELEKVSKSFGPLAVLQDLDLCVSQGETVALIGPSGSGKTTVLRLCMMLDTPSSGDIRLFGDSIVVDEGGMRKRPRDLAAVRRRCGMVFQQYNLFPHMTVLDNLVLAPRSVLGVSKEESEKTAQEMLELVGLPDKAAVYPAKLSGGQQQRIAIARALALHPDVLFLDEITSALDPELVGEVLQLVRRLAFETDITCLIVTHEMGFARHVADRVAMFDRGVVLEIGPPEDVFGSPQHERTSLFLRSVLDR